MVCELETLSLVQEHNGHRLREKSLQRLIGYFVHKPNLGCVEGHDPLCRLRGGCQQEEPFEEFLPDAVKPIIAAYRREAAS